jgi:hypothetical protein
LTGMYSICAQIVRTILAMAAMSFALAPALSPGQSTDLRPNSVQLAVACPNTRELVIDDIKICYFTCPDMSTSIRIAADQICPPFH